MPKMIYNVYKIDIRVIINDYLPEENDMSVSRCLKYNKIILFIRLLK